MSFEERLQQAIDKIELNVFYEHFTKQEEELDPSLIEYLQSARTCLNNNGQIETAKCRLKILLEYSWEKLNTGIWQNVKDAYRYLYAYACYMDVLIDCRHGNYQVNVYSMGHPLL